MEHNEIKEAVKSYICENHLANEDSQEVSETTPLITSAILNSLSTLELVSFLEDTYGIDIEAHEVGIHNLNTLEAIAKFVESKR